MAKLARGVTSLKQELLSQHVQKSPVVELSAKYNRTRGVGAIAIAVAWFSGHDILVYVIILESKYIQGTPFTAEHR